MPAGPEAPLSAAFERLAKAGHVRQLPTREELVARYGQPELMGHRDGGVFVFGHDSEEAAEAFSDANRRRHGHKADVEQSPEGRWLSVVRVEVPKGVSA